MVPCQRGFMIACICPASRANHNRAVRPEPLIGGNGPIHVKSFNASPSRKTEASAQIGSSAAASKAMPALRLTRRTSTRSDQEQPVLPSLPQLWRQPDDRRPSPQEPRWASPPRARPGPGYRPTSSAGMSSRGPSQCTRPANEGCTSICSSSQPKPGPLPASARCHKGHWSIALCGFQ